MHLLTGSVLIFLILAGVNGAYYSVFQNSGDNSYYVKGGKWDSAIAWAFYADEVETTGWARLYVTTNSQFDDKTQVYAAGYLEGVITAERIWQSYYNFQYSTFPSGKIPQALKDWIGENLGWMEARIDENPNDPYWQQVDSVLTQLKGISDGYLAKCKKGEELSFIEQILQNADGDLEDLNTLITGQSLSSFPFNTHCSSLIKQTPDKQELFSGHTTWSSYASMLRTYKIYNFNLHSPDALAKKVSFSSYPAYLGSVDDFYITSTGLSVIETTNSIFNQSLYQYVTPETCLSWIRTIVANRMAKDGKTWTEIFAKYNSGTYNNQWIITDYNKFHPGAKLNPGTLWILEQIPGMCESADVTSVMEKQGYWPSYNIPYFPKIYNISGYPAMVAKYGDSYSYTKCPRAQIFARDHANVDSMSQYKWILRYNGYPWDPIAKNPGNAISSRFDLDPNSPNPFGGVDTKVTSKAMIKKLIAEGISGPTFYQQKAFEWSAPFNSTKYLGMPYRFNFDWQTFVPDS